MPDSNPIYDRAKGYYPLSVGTSLALEALFGLKVEDGKLLTRSDVAPYKGRRSLWVNTNTLYRNYTNAFEKDTYLSVSPSKLLEAFAEEIDMFENIVREEAPELELKLYHATYEGLQRRFPAAKLRQPTTAKQVEDYNLQNGLIQAYLKSPKGQNVIRFKGPLPQPTERNVIVMTNNATDLWEIPRGSDSLLLESFTGALKPPSQWNTKLYKGSESNWLPFNPGVQAIMGDSEVFHPQPIRIKRVFLQMTLDNHWTSLTTVDKIRANIERLPAGEEKDIIQSFFALRA